MHLKDLNCWEKRKYTESLKGLTIKIVSIDNHPYRGNINAKIYIFFTTKDCAEMNTKLLQNHAQI